MVRRWHRRFWGSRARFAGGIIDSGVAENDSHAASEFLGRQSKVRRISCLISKFENQYKMN